MGDRSTANASALLRGSGFSDWHLGCSARHFLDQLLSRAMAPFCRLAEPAYGLIGVLLDALPLSSLVPDTIASSGTSRSLTRFRSATATRLRSQSSTGARRMGSATRRTESRSGTGRARTARTALQRTASSGTASRSSGRATAGRMSSRPSTRRARTCS